MSEKTEQPTEKRRRDGRKEGQVAKSNEIVSGIQLLAMLLFWHFFYDMLLARISSVFVLTIGLINQPFLYALSVVLRALWFSGGLIFLLFGSILIMATILSVLLQVGLVLASKALGINAQRINPVNNLKQIFSVHSAIELLKSTLKVLVLTLMFAGLFYHYAPILKLLPYCHVSCVLPLFSIFIRWIWYGLIGFYIVLGVFDYFFQIHNTLKQQRMSKQEIQQERKDVEGDPYMKRRRIEMQRELQSGSLAQHVRKSAVVVRNPTHIAICLGYNPVLMPVPRVLEKGVDARASHIVDLAHRLLIPVIENISLSRALFYNVKCGDRIPPRMFEPVAAVLRQVLEINYPADDKQEILTGSQDIGESHESTF